MTDDARPAHPPPWRWVQRKMGNWSDDDERAADRLVLVDANGDYIIDTDGDDYSWVTVETPYVRSVTELAPEMEALLREETKEAICSLWHEWHMRQAFEEPRPKRCGACWPCRADALLAILDAARKANP